MKKICTFLTICFFTLQAQTPRNLIVALDWENERVAYELDNINLELENTERGFGPVTGELVTALAQKAAPIITTSSLWHNFVARRKLFEDFLKGQTLIYKGKYKRFDEAIIKKFQAIIQSYFQPPLFDMTLLRHQSQWGLDNYFLCYAIPFQENDWIIKKASDYIYLLIPREYLEKLKESKELEKSDEIRLKLLPKAGTERNFATSLSDDDLRLGLKIDPKKILTMSYQDALDPNKHKLSINKDKYTQLVTQNDMLLIKELFKKHVTVPESFILSRHFINVLKNIFITEQDLTKDKAKADLYRAIYLHKWHIYLSGHGKPSDPGTLQDIDFSEIHPATESSLAGIDLFSFRKWLAFLQTSIKTEFLFYETCYAGGQHLHKLFEHYWEYSTGTTLKQEVKSDAFNYMIVDGNLEYTPTKTSLPHIYPPYKKIPRNEINIDYKIQFSAFFKALEKYFSIGHVEMGDKKLYFETLRELQKEKAKLSATEGILSPINIRELRKKIENLQKKLDSLQFITLNGVIDYVHNVKEYRPAVRYPGTDFFVPLPLDENKQVAERLRDETNKQKEERKNEEARVKKVIEQQISGEGALIKALYTLQKSLIQLKRPILH